MFRQSPGACPICGQAHTACVPQGVRSDVITVAQLPARDAARSHETVLAEAQRVDPGAMSTKTYPHPSVAERDAALASGVRHRRGRR